MTTTTAPDQRATGFAAAILSAAAEAEVTSGLYYGCGMGSTFAALVDAGLDLVGLEPSPTALARVAARLPGHRHRLVCGTLDALPPGERYALVVGTLAFAHGSRQATVDRLREAQRRLAPGGLFCLRVPATGSDVWPAHDVMARHADGGLSVRFRTAHASGSEAHLFSAGELEAMFAGRFTPVVPPRPTRTARRPPIRGSGVEWEAIWRRTG